MPATFAIPLVVPIPGQIISASLFVNEWANLYNNLIPAGIDTYSGTTSQMQIQTDPYPLSVVSRPTSLAGEIERLRFATNGITGETYWYQPPADTLSGLDGRVTTLEALIPAGTVMLFFQAAAPTGWTKVTTQNDKALRIVSGTGGGAGGTVALSSGLAHTHTISNHVHSIPSASIDHRHVTPVISLNASGGGLGNDNNSTLWQDTGDEQVGGIRTISKFSQGGNTAANDYFLKTKVMANYANGNSGNPTTNPASGSTDAGSLAYADIIACSKD